MLVGTGGHWPVHSTSKTSWWFTRYVSFGNRYLSYINRYLSFSNCYYICIHVDVRRSVGRSSRVGSVGSGFIIFSMVVDRAIFG